MPAYRHMYTRMHVYRSRELRYNICDIVIIIYCNSSFKVKGPSQNRHNSLNIIIFDIRRK